MHRRHHVAHQPRMESSQEDLSMVRLNEGIVPNQKFKLERARRVFADDLGSCGLYSRLNTKMPCGTCRPLECSLLEVLFFWAAPAKSFDFLYRFALAIYDFRRQEVQQRCFLCLLLLLSKRGLW